MSSLPDDFNIKQLSDREYKGLDFNIDPDLIEEPFEKRKCTDCIFGIFFALFLGGLITLQVLGY